MPLAVGAMVFAGTSWASYVPPLPEWQVAKSKSELNGEVHILAAQTLDRNQHRSITENLEYCGYLYRGLNSLGATQPLVGDHESCPVDAGLGIVAIYHSHAAFDPDYDNEVPSVDDLRIVILQGFDGYIATPGGRLWYLSEEHEAAMLLCGEACLQQDPNFQPCPAMDNIISFHMDELLARNSNSADSC